MSGSLLVIAPHPDDEILGAGAVMARFQENGGTVSVMVLTDGSASDPDVAPAVLATQRERECKAGLKALLGAPPSVIFLGYPDGQLSGARIDLSAAPLAGFLKQAAPETILVTDPADGHPDHKAAFGLATRLISAGIGCRLHVMPVGQRVDRTFEPTNYVCLPVGSFADRKAEAIACHVSQMRGGDGFSLDPGIVTAFVDAEYLRSVYDCDDANDDAVPAGHFDAMFDASSDPWRYDDEPYERDRFARTYAALADRHYSSALELGCANGALTEHLAPLCTELLATDASRSALAAAQERLGGLPDVTLAVAPLPRNVPEGPFDLIVASDLLYYLGLDGIVTTMTKLERQATDDCRILIASYLGATDTRMTGEMSSEAAIAHLVSWHRVHVERTDRLRIDVLERRCA